MLERMQELNRTIGQLGERPLIDARRTNMAIHYIVSPHGWSSWIIREFPTAAAFTHARRRPIRDGAFIKDALAKFFCAFGIALVEALPAKLAKSAFFICLIEDDVICEPLAKQPGEFVANALTSRSDAPLPA